MPSFWVKKAAGSVVCPSNWPQHSVCLLYIVYELDGEHLRVTKVLPHFCLIFVCFFYFLAGMWVTLWAISTHGSTTGAERIWKLLEERSSCTIQALTGHNHDQAMTNSVVLL